MTLTGPFAQIGEDTVNGTELDRDENDRQVTGRTIELIVRADLGGAPAYAAAERRTAEGVGR